MPEPTPGPAPADSATSARAIPPQSQMQNQPQKPRAFRRMVAGLAALATALSLFAVDAAPARAAGRDDDMLNALIALGVVGVIANEVGRDKKRDRDRARDRDRRPSYGWHDPRASRRDDWRRDDGRRDDWRRDGWRDDGWRGERYRPSRSDGYEPRQPSRPYPRHDRQYRNGWSYER